ncbi:MAG: glycine cleavage system protein [Moorella sp. (in: firmicutes)]|jgi:glycine cleavage system H protein|uniref:glycine cleavage system protein GcvH n=1 Tax=unclassified Neomoorella TaxID=2676739 RepID=UPI0010FFB89D|nr:MULTISPECIES: glycine cleavage system protein GcvH [unclassified Moorella (in: firmicutes)]MDK2815888.1 glycine cleavage system protein [Moorella sp. (in: firmicutes)]MDK2895831.1 glycine cleavage system protein [Moorella sp. (in: firmicutes)]GEA13891.1 glycine cleavage system H protein [Moorella sp. E308F]GEA18737.1 glycine cleavage system H protein [Moorella sp. E306M]
MEFPANLYYSKDHEWVEVEGNRARIGITDYAQESLGDIVFVELPQVGDELAAGDSFGVVESVKSASDVYAPVGGKVVAVNEALLDSPQDINADPYGKGWMIELEMSDPDEIEDLMDAGAYRQLVKEEKGE